MFDYKLIEAIAMVIEEGGFDKAAKKLNITQSAVSQRIRQLEEQTGRVLLTRSTPPVPTTAGSRFLKHFLQVKRLEGDLDKRLKSVSEQKAESLSIGINADSLETWFIDAVNPFLRKNKVLLDVKVDDQDETHKLLKNGEVAGCISARKTPVQGCTATHIGTMVYRLLATPFFINRYFRNGFTIETVKSTPLVIFNRKDNLQSVLLKKIFSKKIEDIPTNYIPSTEKFVAFILNGHAYGAVPDEQSRALINKGTLVELAPGSSISIDLYWHCWNIKSELLEKFTEALSKGLSENQKY